MRSASQAILLCAPLLLATGCLPIIAHPPHVENGSRLSLAGGVVVSPLTNGDDSVQHSVTPLPTFAVRGSYGMRSARDADGFGLELGGELLFPAGLAADVYLQAPSRATGETDFGVGFGGIAGAMAGPMIYAQAGRRVSSAFYLFTTQSVSRFTRRVDLQNGNNRPAISWQPTIALEPIGEWSPIRYFFLTATVGRTFNGCFRVIWACNRSSPASIALGAVVSRLPAPRQ